MLRYLLCLTLILQAGWAYAQDPPGAPEKSPEPAAAVTAEMTEEPDAAIAEPPLRKTLLETDAEVSDAVAVIEQFVDAHPKADETTPPEGFHALNVRQCVELALSQNAKVLVADDDVNAAIERIGQARSAMLPQAKVRYGMVKTEMNTPETKGNPLQLLGTLGQGLSNNGGGGNNTALSIVLPVAFSLGGSALENLMTPQLTPDDTFEKTEVTISQTLYAGGQIQAAIKSSEFLAKSQEWKRVAVLAEIEYGAKAAFYNAIMAEAMVRVATESVNTYQRTVKDANEMFDVGMISNFEVLSAKTQLGIRETALLSARNGYELALANLRTVMFLPQNAPIKLDFQMVWPPLDTPLTDLVELAVDNRPELLALRRGIDASREGVKGAKGAYKPKFAASATYSNTQDGGLSTPDGWTFTIGGEWDIITGGKRKHAVREAQASHSSLRHQLIDAEELVKLDVTRSFIQIQDAMAQVKSVKATVGLAQEGLRLAELRFQEGVGTQSETLDAELALSQSESNLFQVLRDYAIAQASLERATGRSWAAKDTAVEPEPIAAPAEAASAVPVEAESK